jgi:hypothetical protein
MIDPAVIDLMHHMSKAPPALERQVSDSAWGSPDLKQGESYVREVEQDVATWIAETERRVTSLAKDIAAHPAPSVLRRLDQMIETFEAAVSSEVAFYRRLTKKSLVIVKRARAIMPAAAPVLTEQRRRILTALAAYGLARSDVVFALRALRSGLDGAGRNGPVFDNASDLGAYLRAAAA